MDPETVMTTVTEGSKAITKFEEIILKVFGPRNTRRQADADTYANEKKLELIRDNPDMDIVFLNGEMSAREKTPEALAYRAQHRELYDSIRQESNLENVLKIADDEVKLLQADEVSDEKVDDDWITRFFSIVKDINSEDMQLIWGKILAGEIKKPGSFSLRTLDVIRNITNSEAAIFNKLLPFVIRNGNNLFVPADNELLDSRNIQYSELMKLDECGLLNSSFGVSLNSTVSINQRAINFNQKRFAEIKGKSSNSVIVSYEEYSLTTAGKELYFLLQHDDDETLIVDFAELIFKKHTDRVSISVYDINSISNDKTINYNTTPVKCWGT